MPTSVTKAVLLNLGVFLAENGIRRSLASFACNFSSASSNVVSNQLSMNPDEIYTWASRPGATAMTLLSTNQPLQVDVTLQSGVTYRMTVRKVHLVDDDVRQLVIENTSASVSNVTIIQT